MSFADGWLSITEDRRTDRKGIAGLCEVVGALLGPASAALAVRAVSAAVVPYFRKRVFFAVTRGTAPTGIARPLLYFVSPAWLVLGMAWMSVGLTVPLAV